MPAFDHIIHIVAAAPAKPEPGAPCNGCGVCCLFEPCPLGVLLSGRRQGACAALRWDDAGMQYRCGAMQVPQEVLAARWPWLPKGWPDGLGRLLARAAPRWVAVGQGCDCDLQVPLPSG